VTKSTLPLRGVSGKKVKAKDGCGLAYADGSVYCLKGGNSREFWTYEADSDKWMQLSDLPVGGGKKVKGGGALTAAGNALYALKGNNTLEFWRYTPSGEMLSRLGSRSYNAEQSASILPRYPFSLSVAPNPFTGKTLISYSLPRSSDLSLMLYDVTGSLARTIARGRHEAGRYNMILNPDRLARGIYFLRLDTCDRRLTQKLILQ
jgi:hypothetical protein